MKEHKLENGENKISPWRTVGDGGSIGLPYEIDWKDGLIWGGHK